MGSKRLRYNSRKLATRFLNTDPQSYQKNQANSDGSNLRRGKFLLPSRLQVRDKLDFKYFHDNNDFPVSTRLKISGYFDEALRYGL